MRLVALALAAALTSPAAAQEIRGIPLGGLIPEDMPEPVGSGIEGAYSITRWTFDDGLSLSASRDAETGEVVYLELWRTDNSGTHPSPIDGLVFGETTRGELHERFGSEGFVFEPGDRFLLAGPTTVWFNNYEIAGSDTVVSFFTIQPTSEASPETANASVLDSMFVAQSAFADQFYGFNRGRLPGYAPIPSPFD